MALDFTFNFIGNFPEIIKDPQDKTILIDRSKPGRAEFLCETTEESTHKWTVATPGQSIFSRITKDKTLSSQRVSINITNNNTEIYCEASNGSGTVRSESAFLTVLG